MYHEVSHIVCFETFSVKQKEHNLARKYRIFGGPAENLSSTISQIEQNSSISFTKAFILYFLKILVCLQSLGAECHRHHF